ncbi:MAG: integrating conjugative element protein [Rhodoferax sp.]|nr:integrating conjugative element protein [Rhodoferax sp.]
MTKATTPALTMPSDRSRKSTLVSTSMQRIAGTTDNKQFCKRVAKTVVTAIVVSAIVAFSITPKDACAQLGPPSNRGGFSKQYYLLGGNDSGSHSLYKNQLALKLGFSADFRFNYSCGKFDIGLSHDNVMNGIATLGATLSSILTAGIAALPLYILQRAQPGLYEVFQTYSVKAQALANASLKSCEDMEAQIKAGGDPYADLLKMSKSDYWKGASAGLSGSNSGDIVATKFDIEKNQAGGNAGIQWIWGKKAGGSVLTTELSTGATVTQDPVKPIEDTTKAGYLQALNLNPGMNVSQITTDFSLIPAYKDSNLVKAFKSPKDASDFSTEVLGDAEIVTCDAGASCPIKQTKTAVGLLPRFDKKVQDIKDLLYGVAGGGPFAVVGQLGKEQSDYKVLQTLSSPGMPVNEDVIQAIRQLPPGPQKVAGDRLAQDIAASKVINEALVIRGVILGGITLPNAVAATPATKEATARLARLETFIDQLLFETRIRKELSNQTALTVLGIRDAQNASSLSQPKVHTQEKSGVILGNAPAP